MSTAIAPRNQADVMEQVVMEGDLSKLSSADRVFYYNRVCESLGLNPLTQPFAYIRLNSKLTLYAKRDCTDQLRKIHKIGVTIASRERQEDVYVVTARATEATGRTDESIGAVSIAGAKGEALANALMKAETKAKRRVTLSICGLGWMDETEISTIQDAQPVQVSEAGEIHSNGKEGTNDPNEHIQAGLTRAQSKEIGRLWTKAIKEKVLKDEDALLAHLHAFKPDAIGRGDLTEDEAKRYISLLFDLLEGQ